MDDSTHLQNKPKKKTTKLKKRTKKITLFSIVSLAMILGFTLSPLSSKLHTSASLDDSKLDALGSFDVTIPNLKYGFVLDTFEVTEEIIKPNQFLSEILIKHKIDYNTIDQLAKKSKDIFDVTQLRANKPYTILNRDTSTAADYFIYEPNVFRYVVYNLKDPSDIQVVERPIEMEVKTASGIVETSLWNTMVDNGLSYELTSRMEDALAWSVDFYHIQKGDKFKLIYEQQYIDGEVVGVGEVYAAYYHTSGNDYYAIYFENEKHNGFFDLEGRSMKKAFLKSPVKYSRISSRFNPRRFHPVLKRVRPHLGTDYAAPKGTPILSVADGVVVAKGYGKGNGRYVKIKHDKSIQTQYLHMSKYAKGVNKGTQVKQGQTIGYVGSTGLATGPHVCFRFWKNGRQVNHLKQNLPPPDPMPAEDLPRYYEVRDEYQRQLDAIPLYTAAELAAQKGEVPIEEEETVSSINEEDPGS